MRKTSGEFLLLWDGQAAGRKTQTGPHYLRPHCRERRYHAHGDRFCWVPPLRKSLAATCWWRRSRPSRSTFISSRLPKHGGLRHGQWKYIGEVRSDHAELYDLASDPGERENIAAQHPDLVAQYRKMCLNWYLDSDRQFTLRLQDYKDVDTSLEKGDTQLGPRVLSVGYPEGAGLHWFVDLSLVHPDQQLLAWTKWATDPESDWRYEWISPSGQKLTSPLEKSIEWHVSISRFPGKRPMEAEIWTLRILRGQDVRLKARFTVTPRAALHSPGGS